jgi:predicted ester cyclase
VEKVSGGDLTASPERIPGTEGASLRTITRAGGVILEANKELARRYFEEIINLRQFDVCAQIIAEAYTEHAVAPFGQSEPGRVIGPSATQESLEWLIAQFPDMHMTIEAIVAENDTVVVRTLTEGTNLGALSGFLPPTGRRFVARQSHWFRVENGKLAEHWATREDLPAMLQLGVIQRPGPPRS